MIQIIQKIQHDFPVFPQLSALFPEGTKPEELFFFDIETTGLSPKHSILYLIGGAFYQNDNWHIIQWLAEEASEEAALLTAFFSYLSNYTTLLSFNGTSFDQRYLESKSSLFHLDCTFPACRHVDLYRAAKPLKALLKLENLKQKTVEQFFAISRSDRFTGGELIETAKDWLHRTDSSIEQQELLLLHNREDITGMLSLFPILLYRELQNGQFCPTSFQWSDAKDSLIVTCTLPFFLPKPFSCSDSLFYLSAKENRLSFVLFPYSGTLKYFYPDYKNYYYLPLEDCAIHKSVASFVDKEHRIKATAATCYSKKEGIFLPQKEPVFTPAFFHSYKDTLSFFPVDLSLPCSDSLWIQYFTSLLS